ncbi:MAG: hypothetical protein RL385_3095 [Pseudomonadota bacterium]|jgi:uncharacterized protein YbjT (DUF2867 family)
MTKDQTTAHPVLVTGATGTLGGLVVERLRAWGVPVRALTRKPAAASFPEDVQVFHGDLAQNELDERALVGVRQVFVFPAEPGIGEFARRLGRAGVEHAVLLAVRAGHHVTELSRWGSRDQGKSIDRS